MARGGGGSQPLGELQVQAQLHREKPAAADRSSHHAEAEMSSRDRSPVCSIHHHTPGPAATDHRQMPGDQKVVVADQEVHHPGGRDDHAGLLPGQVRAGRLDRVQHQQHGRDRSRGGGHSGLVHGGWVEIEASPDPWTQEKPLKVVGGSERKSENRYKVQK